VVGRTDGTGFITPAAGAAAGFFDVPPAAPERGEDALALDAAPSSHPVAGGGGTLVGDAVTLLDGDTAGDGVFACADPALGVAHPASRNASPTTVQVCSNDRFTGPPLWDDTSAKLLFPAFPPLSVCFRFRLRTVASLIPLLPVRVRTHADKEKVPSTSDRRCTC
jgi:hypothetical protein